MATEADRRNVQPKRRLIVVKEGTLGLWVAWIIMMSAAVLNVFGLPRWVFVVCTLVFVYLIVKDLW